MSSIPDGVMTKSTTNSLGRLSPTKSLGRLRSIKNPLELQPYHQLIYDAGGGPGRENLTFDILTEGQKEMFVRTLVHQAPLVLSNRSQESRQVKIRDNVITVVVNVCREDFPDIQANVVVTYHESAPQEAWEQLLRDICKGLKIEFIDTILDRADHSPVFRIQRFRLGGQYLVRQRESSAVLEVLNTGIDPKEVSWPLTRHINDAKKNLAFDDKSMPVIDSRVRNLVGKSMTRKSQWTLANEIMHCRHPGDIVKAIENFEIEYEKASIEEKFAAIEDEKERIRQQKQHFFQKKDEIADLQIFEGKIDLVTLHRIAIESLSRFASFSSTKKVSLEDTALFSYPYLEKTIRRFMQEVDILVMGMKCLSDLVKFCNKQRESMFHLVLDAIQAYSAPAAPHRPRNPKRLKMGNNSMDFLAQQLTQLEAASSSKTNTTSSSKKQITTSIPSATASFGNLPTATTTATAATEGAGGVIKQLKKGASAGSGLSDLDNIREVTTAGSVADYQRYGHFYPSTTIYPSTSIQEGFAEIQNELHEKAMQYAAKEFKQLQLQATAAAAAAGGVSADAGNEGDDPLSASPSFPTVHASTSSSLTVAASNKGTVPPPVKFLVTQRARYKPSSALEALSAAFEKDVKVASTITVVVEPSSQPSSKSGGGGSTSATAASSIYKTPVVHSNSSKSRNNSSSRDNDHALSVRAGSAGRDDADRPKSREQRGDKEDRGSKSPTASRQYSGVASTTTRSRIESNRGDGGVTRGDFAEDGKTGHGGKSKSKERQERQQMVLKSISEKMLPDITNSPEQQHHQGLQIGESSQIEPSQHTIILKNKKKYRLVRSSRVDGRSRLNDPNSSGLLPSLGEGKIKSWKGSSGEVGRLQNDSELARAERKEKRRKRREEIEQLQREYGTATVSTNPHHSSKNDTAAATAAATDACTTNLDKGEGEGTSGSDVFAAVEKKEGGNNKCVEQRNVVRVNFDLADVKRVDSSPAVASGVGLDAVQCRAAPVTTAASFAASSASPAVNEVNPSRESTHHPMLERHAGKSGSADSAHQNKNNKNNRAADVVKGSEAQGNGARDFADVPPDRSKGDGADMDRDENPPSSAGGTYGRQIHASSAKSDYKNRQYVRRKKIDLLIDPLPEVPCAIFRGLSSLTLSKNMAIVQCFATLQKIIAQNYGNRDCAFKLGVVDEICEIALVSQGLPRVLEHIIWIIDTLFADGFGFQEIVDGDDDDYSMQLSDDGTASSNKLFSSGQNGEKPPALTIKSKKSSKSGANRDRDAAKVAIQSDSLIGVRKRTQSDSVVGKINASDNTYNERGIGGTDNRSSILMPVQPLSEGSTDATVHRATVASLAVANAASLGSANGGGLGGNVGKKSDRKVSIASSAGGIPGKERPSVGRIRSSSRRGTEVTTDTETESVDSLTGMVIETMSELSQPSVDVDGTFEEPTPRINFDGNWEKENTGLAVAGCDGHSGGKEFERLGLKTGNSNGTGIEMNGDAGINEEKRKEGTGSDDEDEKDLSQDISNIAIFEIEEENDPVKIRKKRLSVATGTSGQASKSGSRTAASGGIGSLGARGAKLQQTKQPAVTKKQATQRAVRNVETELAMGADSFEARFMHRPADVVILAVSMISAHHDLEERERQVALRWLELWDDCSRQFHMLLNKGKNINGI